MPGETHASRTAEVMTQPVMDPRIVELPVVDCDALAQNIIDTALAGARAVLIDFTREDRDQWPTEDLQRAEALGHLLLANNTAIACVVPEPHHHIAIQCLYIYRTGARALSATDRTEAIQWLSAQCANSP